MIESSINVIADEDEEFGDISTTFLKVVSVVSSSFSITFFISNFTMQTMSDSVIYSAVSLLYTINTRLRQSSQGTTHTLTRVMLRGQWGRVATPRDLGLFKMTAVAQAVIVPTERATSHATISSRRGQH